MLACYKAGDFNKYFTENMNQLGLSVPASLFDSAEKAVSVATAMVATLTQLSKGATIAELVGATTGLEKLLVIGSLSAAGYVGAVIGSIAVATGRVTGCGSQISDLFVRKYQLKFKGWHMFYASNPQILNKNIPSRKTYGVRCKLLNTFEYA